MRRSLIGVVMSVFASDHLSESTLIERIRPSSETCLWRNVVIIRLRLSIRSSMSSARAPKTPDADASGT